MLRKLTEQDVDMFFFLEDLKKRSRCIDKQVACIIVDDDYNILASGVNTVLECDKNCHDKERRLCKVRHAEAEAVDRLADRYCTTRLDGPRHRKAYVSLFPCKACQEIVLPYVDEIVTFGMIHKDWVSGDKLTVFHHLSYTLLKHNGEEKQRTICAGELAELITAISDVLVRVDKNRPMEELIDEMIDVEVQTKILSIIAHGHDSELYNKLRSARSVKTMNLLNKYGEHGTTSYFYDKSDAP
jgi:deoxycytidylate deaminase